VNEINAQKDTLGIKKFEYSSEAGLIEFNDDITGQQAATRMAMFKDRLVRQVTE
jgi:hypothetical protein